VNRGLTVYGICSILFIGRLAAEFENPLRKAAATYGSMCCWGKEFGWMDVCGLNTERRCGMG